MKRSVVFVLAMALLLSACIPALPFQRPANESPSVDTQATDEALAATLVAATLINLPTPTLEATDTSEPTATYTETAKATGTVTTDSNTTATETLKPVPNATGSVTPTNTATTTGTAFTATATITGTPATPTPTETLYARFYGTLPPSIPYGKIRLVNKSKAEVYVSLQCTTADGHFTILEYPVPGRMRVSAPAGKYTYVAWVGGRQFQGWFDLGKRGEREIIFNKDKVTIK